MALKTCITNYSFAASLRAGRMSIEGFCDFCGKAGFEGADFISYFWKDKDAEMKALSGWLARNRVALAGYGTRSNFLSRKPEEAEQSFANVRTAIDDAARIGSKMVRVFGGSSLDGWTIPQATEQVVASFRKLMPQAEKTGVVLTIENHGGFPATADEVIAVIRGVDSPCFAALLDTANFLGAAADPLVESKKLISYVRHVHVKDMLKFPLGSPRGYKPGRADYHLEGCVIGRGIVPNKEILAALKAAGYDGWVSIEAEGPEGEDESQRVLDGLAAIRAWLKEIGN